MAEAAAAAAVSEAADGVRIAVRVSPGASREGVTGLSADGASLRVAVTAPPEGGKANAAAIRLLAKAWRVPKSAVTVVAGAAGRDKTLLVRGEPAGLARRIREWIAAHAEG